jgi:FixJ family two-component response regulator
MTHRCPEFLAAVVDDNQRILEALADLLQSAGYAVRLFASAAALLESGSLADIDCLISDIDLPKIDGFELLRLTNAARPELPVILITGHYEMWDRSPNGGSANYRLFKKPFDGQKLLTAVSEAVRHSDRLTSQSRGQPRIPDVDTSAS